ncbi:MAG TPA: carboxypeptidase-like regulatory domain-containing protein, partial [Polyangiaceae bacterium]
GGSDGGTTSGASGAGGSRGGSPSTGGRGGSATGGAGDGGMTGGQAGESGGSGGAEDGGEGGRGPDDTSVTGRVVDFWLQPLANVPVTIGTQTVATDAQGRFSIAGVAPEYDASLFLTWPGGQPGRYAWRFEGLTRRDPTLQVYKGRENRYADIVLEPQGATLDATRVLSVGLGGPNGASRFEDVGESGRTTSVTWYGPPTTQANLHALVWAFDDNELPTAYHSYETTTASFDSTSSADTTVALNLADEDILSGTIGGTVTSPSSSSDRTNYAFVRFADHASIRLLIDYAGPDAFSYLFPQVPDSDYTIAASYGNSTFGAYGIAHRDVFLLGQTGHVITIPAAATQVVPVSGISNVNANTQFSWSGVTGPCVFHAEDLDFYEGIFVVTTRRNITFPTFGNFVPRAGASYNWRVETHGSATSVDELAGSFGYLDSFSRMDDYEEGPRMVYDGSYTISTGRRFTTAP